MSSQAATAANQTSRDEAQGSAGLAPSSNAHRYPCTNCGANTSFVPSKQALGCAHCDHVMTFQVVPHAEEHPIESAGALATTRDITEGAHEAVCKTCGARTLTSKQSERCPFCDSPIVLDNHSPEPAISPHNLLPFLVDQTAANDAFLRWLHSRWFAPRKLATRAARDGLDGVYLPHWTYDAETASGYTGARGDNYTDTETYTDSQGKTQTRTVVKTRWTNVSGHVDVPFDDVVVCATESVPARLVSRLEPWDLGNLVAFDGRFLAGFATERYRIDVHSGLELAKEKMAPVIRTAIRRDIGGDQQNIHEVDTRYNQVTFKHTLLPMWVSSFRFGERVYRVLVNARTGEVSGERPYSAFKIALTVLLVLAAIVGVIVLLQRR